MEYVIYDIDYLDICIQDFPEKDNVMICLDPQKRLGEKTWAVLITTGSEPEIPAKAQGLFWDQERAVIFAEALIKKGL